MDTDATTGADELHWNVTLTVFPTESMATAVSCVFSPTAIEGWGEETKMLATCADGPLPPIVHVGHRDLFLPADVVARHFHAVIRAEEFAAAPRSALQCLAEHAASAERVWIDIDCDVLDPGFFPAVDGPLPFGLALAGKGIRALIEDPHLRAGLNVHRGQITNRAVADSQNLPAAEPETILAA